MGTKEGILACGEAGRLARNLQFHPNLSLSIQFILRGALTESHFYGLRGSSFVCGHWKETTSHMFEYSRVVLDVSCQLDTYLRIQTLVYIWEYKHQLRE